MAARRLRRLGARLRGLFARVERRPVIVLGNQKSGTSAVAHLLAELCGLSKTIDIQPLMGAAGHAVMKGERRLADVVRRHPECFSTALIKEPMMTFFAGQVLEVFPESRVVFVVRDPRDNIRSLLNRRGLPGDLEELSDELRASLGRRVTLDPEVWGGGDENYVGVLAHRWNRAADAYLEHEGRVELVRYEEFVADKQGSLERLARRLGLEPRHDVSALLDVDFQPRGTRGASWDAFFGPRNLGRIERICGTRMARLGYAPAGAAGAQGPPRTDGRGPASGAGATG